MNHTVVQDHIALHDPCGRVGAHDVCSTRVRHEREWFTCCRGVVATREVGRVDNRAIDDVIGKDSLNLCSVELTDHVHHCGDGRVVGCEYSEGHGAFKRLEEVGLLDDAGERGDELSSRFREIQRQTEDLVDDVDHQVCSRGRTHGGDVHGRLDNLKRRGTLVHLGEDERCRPVGWKVVFSTSEQSSRNSVVWCSGRTVDRVGIVQDVVRQDLGEKGRVGDHILRDVLEGRVGRCEHGLQLNISS